MKLNIEELTKSLLESLNNIESVKSADIPNIDLYMDQVTTFMEGYLKDTRRHSADKILTKTMINNYAKNKLLPAPVKKKYTRDHVMIMVFIYYFKNILSINDIEKLLSPLNSRYFGKDEHINLREIYDTVQSVFHSQIGDLGESIKEKYRVCSSVFPDAGDTDREFLEVFTFICSLMFDVYAKKLMIEKILDNLPDGKL